MSLPASKPEPAGKLHLLVVDEDAAVRSACCEIAASRGFQTRGVTDLEAARGLLRAGGADILLIDLKRGADGRNGMELIEEVKLLQPEIAVIAMTAFATVASAVEAMRIGASDYLSKPFLAEDLTTILERIAEHRRVDVASRALRERLRQPSGLSMIVGSSPEMEKLYRILSKVAQTTHPVLILGESGTGKELVARAIHSNGALASKPFLPIDCGSLASAQVEAELFGRAKGAQPAAHGAKAKDGLLVAAQGGTVFLDEVGELPLDLQVKLLRALQEREVRPLGATQSVPFQARILAATNRDLAALVEQGRFRRDLYYRLNVVSLRIPPLRERREDIPLLATHFLERAIRTKKQHYVLSDDALRIMSDYAWPGNVRELENSIERACALSTGPVLHIGDLPTQLQDFRLHTHRADANSAKAASEPRRPEQTILPLAEIERQAILGALRNLKGDKLRAARSLGIGKTTLYRKLKEYRISDAGA